MNYPVNKTPLRQEVGHMGPAAGRQSNPGETGFCPVGGIPGSIQLKMFISLFSFLPLSLSLPFFFLLFFLSSSFLPFFLG